MEVSSTDMDCDLCKSITQEMSSTDCCKDFTCYHKELKSFIDGDTTVFRRGFIWCGEQMSENDCRHARVFSKHRVLCTCPVRVRIAGYLGELLEQEKAAAGE